LVMLTLFIIRLVPLRVVGCLFFHTTNLAYSIFRNSLKPPLFSLVPLVSRNNLTRFLGFKEVNSYGMA
jgi:hypothetical protein